MWLKSRYLQKKQSHFGSETRCIPKDKKAVCGIVQRRDSLKSLYLTAAFPYALRGASHGIASRDFVCRKSPHHSRNRLTLWGRSPQSPERRDEKPSLIMLLSAKQETSRLLGEDAENRQARQMIMRRRSTEQLKRSHLKTDRCKIER